MRAQAAARRAHPRIVYVGGRADAIPLAGGSCAAAWLSTVTTISVISPRSRSSCAGWSGPGPPVLIREGFTGRIDRIPWLRYFPEALAVTETFWPSVDAVVDAFAPAGFRFEALQPVEQITARNLAAYADLVRVRADSTLIQLSDDQFAAGMNRLDEAATTSPRDKPVTTTLDLLVLR
jgi:hypothetical protein